MHVHADQLTWPLPRLLVQLALTGGLQRARAAPAVAMSFLRWEQGLGARMWRTAVDHAKLLFASLRALT